MVSGNGQVVDNRVAEFLAAAGSVAIVPAEQEIPAGWRQVTGGIVREVDLIWGLTGERWELAPAAVGWNVAAFRCVIRPIDL